jgi:hypothetical protein
MSAETLARCIVYPRRSAADTLILHHFGEPLMHPHLLDRLNQIAEAGLNIEFSSNGLLLDELLPKLMTVKAKISITLSGHQWSNHHPNVYFNALREYQEKITDTNVTIKRAFNITQDKVHLHKWLGAERRDVPREKCFFISDNWGVILWNGDIASCCADCDGASVIGNIHNDGADQAKVVPWSGCPTCDMFKA